MASIDHYFMHFEHLRAPVGGASEEAGVTFADTKLVFHGNQPSVFFEDEGGVPYRGQDHVKRRLQMMIGSLNANERIKTLLTGPAGSGKTALAWIVAKRIQERHQSLGLKPGKFFEILPSQIESKADLDVFMHQLSERDVVFIDEGHIIQKNVGAEPLYHTLDDTGVPRYPLGKGKGWLNVPKTASWLVATTEPGELDTTTGGALRRRLSPELRLDPPGDDVLAMILMDQDTEITVKAAVILASRSGGLPWQALLLYQAAKETARFHGNGIITEEIAEDALKTLGVDTHGLTMEDRMIIFTLLESPYRTASGEVKYKMSETALCAATGIDKHTYKQIIQPKLMRQGFLTTVGGQSLTQKAVGMFK